MLNTTLKTLTLIVVIISLITAYFWYGTPPKQNLVEEESLSSAPNYFITQVHVKEYNSNGVLIETLNAEQTLHYSDGSKTLLQRPSVERKSESGSWSAKSDKGVIHDGSNDILLTNNASATKKYLQSDDITLNADSIHYLDKDKSLTSQGNPALLSPQGETSADTITTYINSEEVVMTGSVRGKYETLD